MYRSIAGAPSQTIELPFDEAYTSAFEVAQRIRFARYSHRQIEDGILRQHLIQYQFACFYGMRFYTVRRSVDRKNRIAEDLKMESANHLDFPNLPLTYQLGLTRRLRVEMNPASLRLGHGT
jgi:hypothetical protein